MIAMLKTTLLPGLFVLLLASCGGKSGGDNTGNHLDTTLQEDQPVIADTTHTSQNTLDWNGTYKGVVPCADCEGIETTLILNADNTYQMRTRYLGKPGDKSFETTGTFSWNAGGNTIILAGVENAPGQYFVGENQLIQLDMSGARITGNLADKYILTKQP
jgi:uncharacterized lipoprotein NlpE involved in copper resistance